MIKELNKICKVKENVDLKKYNTYRLNSVCDDYFSINVDELKKFKIILINIKSKYFIIGNGSNIILPEYYDGVVINLNNFK